MNAVLRLLVLLMIPLAGFAAEAPHRMLCWEYGSQWAIREGLTYAWPGKNAKKPMLGLYDLSQDIGESRDRSAEQPERVKTLQADWNAWLKSIGGKMPALETRARDVNDAP